MRLYREDASNRYSLLMVLKMCTAARIRNSSHEVALALMKVSERSTAEGLKHLQHR